MCVCVIYTCVYIYIYIYTHLYISSDTSNNDKHMCVYIYIYIYVHVYLHTMSAIQECAARDIFAGADGEEPWLAVLQGNHLTSCMQ